VATVIQVEKPKETWQEIRKLIEHHYQLMLPHGQLGGESFMKTYPEIYHLYLQIIAHKEEFGLEN